MKSKLITYLNNEITGLWINEENSTVDVILKTNLPIIKSVWLGAPVELVISLCTQNNTLALALIIYDNKENPFIVTYPPREEEEINGLGILLSGEYRKLTLSLYDAHTIKTLELTVQPPKKTPCDLYGSIFTDGLFSFQLISEYKQGIQLLNDLNDFLSPYNLSHNTMKIARVPLNVIDKKAFSTEIHEPNDTVLSYEVTVSKDGSEGYEQEDHINHALRQLFSFEDVFVSPTIIEGTKERELVDSLVVDEGNILSIQSKAASLIEVGLKSHQKLCSIYKKKSLQGLNQVAGVIPLLENDLSIKYNGNEHLIKKRKNIYHLVIISDLLLDKDGDKNVFDKVQEFYTNKGCKALVMSLDGLVNFIKLSRLHKPLFWAMMEEKFQASLKHKTVLIRDIDSSQEHNLPLLAPEHITDLFK
ncbi:hypothetical protein [Yersinia pseudotuberculosis]|uniref:hypothetical protein n=1 Tax=Yersinia pseudotuberculosis TaxID=633 RepID=UPI002B3101E1|nr:hypothetical protein YPSE1_45090 [Yersinia pseudotuberculosis]